MMRLSTFVWVITLAGCNWVGTFRCTNDTACDADPGGVCEPSGECSYPDVACDSGRRYSARASGIVASTCVEPECRADEECRGVSSTARCCGFRCIDPTTDVAHCGACGNACGGANPACCDGSCSDLANDVSHCGACDLACSTTNLSSVACVAGACAGTCVEGFASCSGNQSTDGCETAITTVDHCGDCATACSNPHGTTACANGACAPTCELGYASCDANDVNGCEILLNGSDPNHCGVCGHVCMGANVATPRCTNGLCTPSCAAGFGDCDGDGENGCEGSLCNATGNTCEASACDIDFDLKLFVSGYWDLSMNPPSPMQALLYNLSVSQGINTGATPTDVDFITVELHEFTDPSKIAASFVACLQVDGTVIGDCGDELLPTVTYPPGPPPGLHFTGVALGTPYWLVVRTRSALETWSYRPLVFPADSAFDFSIAASQAYGSNQIEVASGVWALRSGDVDQNGVADIADFAAIESVAAIGGGYFPEDATGDGAVDGSDFTAASPAILVRAAVKHPAFPAVPTLGVQPSATQSANTLDLDAGPANLGGSPPYEFSWAGPDALFTSDQKAPHLPLGSARAGVYTVTVTDRLGRRATGSVYAKVTRCSVQAGGPCLSLGSDSPTCNGSAFSAALIADIPPNSGALLHEWSGPPGWTPPSPFTSVQSVDVRYVSPPIPGTYSLTVTDSMSRFVTVTTEVTVHDCDHLRLELLNCMKGAPDEVTFDLLVTSDGSPTSDIRGNAFQVSLEMSNLEGIIAPGVGLYGQYLSGAQTGLPAIYVSSFENGLVSLYQAPHSGPAPQWQIDQPLLVGHFRVLPANPTSTFVAGQSTTLKLFDRVEPEKVRTSVATFLGSDTTTTQFAETGTGDKRLTVINSCAPITF